ncbi:hypothetical protein BDFB_010096 [Asbolus verrucosus]|uniref:Phage integrase domain containing protein n=1 Tax=Asbolus verrucosus TaxID=1661398 RepID=A0A482VPA9_ASBVE|nr:hypothetical protein BDFB_010096 [Asbolus verrucosus]
MSGPEESLTPQGIKEAAKKATLIVALTLGISGALRREELSKMKPGDIEFRNDVVVVTIPETKTGIPSYLLSLIH